jgi:hypothetical protein
LASDRASRIRLAGKENSFGIGKDVRATRNTGVATSRLRFLRRLALCILDWCNLFCFEAEVPMLWERSTILLMKVA